MLTDLTWLEPGGEFPPACERARLTRYAENEKLFLTEHTDVWKDRFAALAAKYKKKNRDVETVINYHQLLSKKTADFVCGKPPAVETEQDTDKLTKALDRLEFFSKLYETVLDISRYGNGVQKLVGQRNSVVQPQTWFPVVDPTDLKYITGHVIAYPTDFSHDGIPQKLYAEVHRAGTVEQRSYNMRDARPAAFGWKGIIGNPESEFSVKKTGLDDFAVQIFSNLTCSSSIYGIDDYAIVNSIISKIMWRLHCADTILDKHSEPSMSGPESALQFDEQTGRWYVPLGSYFKRASGEDADVRYVTWDGNLDSNFKELEILFNQLYILTEMGQAFNDAGGAAASSGTALELRMVSPRIKANRLVGINAPPVKRTITSVAMLNGIAIDYDGLTLHWNNGLPEDEKERIGTLTTATGGKPVMSQYAAMKKMGLSDEQVEAELEQLRAENAAYAPITLGLIDGHEDEVTDNAADTTDP